MESAYSIGFRRGRLEPGGGRPGEQRRPRPRRQRAPKADGPRRSRGARLATV